MGRVVGRWRVKKDKSEKIHWLRDAVMQHLGDDTPPWIECGANHYGAVMTYDKKKVTCSDCLVGRAALLRRDERKKK